MEAASKIKTKFWRNLFLVTLTLGIGGIPVQAQKKPNVIVIFGDDVGCGDLGSYGGGITRGAPTPNLDRIAAERCRQLGVVAGSMQQPVGLLSGGNQQKVVFAKWIEAAPSLLVLDDPTRGIDIGAKREMHRIMRCLARSGRVVLFFSSDPGEIVAVSDRVIVFVDGVLTRELDGDALTEHELVTAMNTGVKPALQPAA